MIQIFLAHGRADGRAGGRTDEGVPRHKTDMPKLTHMHYTHQVQLLKSFKKILIKLSNVKAAGAKLKYRPKRKMSIRKRIRPLVKVYKDAWVKGSSGKFGELC